MKLDALKQQYLFGADRMLDDFLRPDDLCATIQNEIGSKIKLQDFDGMYQEGGRPTISPKVLPFVLIILYLEESSLSLSITHKSHTDFDTELNFT